MVAASFENQRARRWYRIEICVDLFGDRLVTKRWGATCSRRGSFHTLVAATPGEQTLEVERETRRRLGRGYTQVSGC